MQVFQTTLLSLLMMVFLPLSAIAADDDPDKTIDDSTSTDAPQTTQKNDGIMLRQEQSIDGYAPLTVAGQQVDAAFLEETFGEPRGAIIFFHDQGEALESWGVVTPLRKEMLQYGWSTLTLALDYPFTPNILLAPDTKIEPPIDAASTTDDSNTAPTPTDNSPDANTDAPKTDDVKTNDVEKEEPATLPPVSNKQRIEAAIAFLKTKDIQRIVFLGHGSGGIAAMNEFTTASTPIAALILVGTPALPKDDDFKALNQPILDIYGELDIEGVSTAVNQRKAVMKRIGNIQYTSREINGANHVFYGLESTLASTVRGWLYTIFVKQEKSE